MCCFVFFLFILYGEEYDKVMVTKIEREAGSNAEPGDLKLHMKEGVLMVPQNIWDSIVQEMNPSQQSAEHLIAGVLCHHYGTVIEVIGGDMDSLQEALQIMRSDLAGFVDDIYLNPQKPDRTFVFNAQDPRSDQ